ncbi:hypothetical protein GALL_493980 [mine drainage metagenome]|uniref:Uncharacterized protein n=1 Tax=mine drainage metagenome TaxID=410659 RepID=A0A1J5PCP2_9ZZZZ
MGLAMLVEPCLDHAMRRTEVLLRIAGGEALVRDEVAVQIVIDQNRVRRECRRGGDHCGKAFVLDGDKFGGILRRHPAAGHDDSDQVPIEADLPRGHRLHADRL